MTFAAYRFSTGAVSGAPRATRLEGTEVWNDSCPLRYVMSSACFRSWFLFYDLESNAMIQCEPTFEFHIFGMLYNLKYSIGPVLGLGKGRPKVCLHVWEKAQREPYNTTKEWFRGSAFLRSFPPPSSPFPSFSIIFLLNLWTAHHSVALHCLTISARKDHDSCPIFQCTIS